MGSRTLIISLPELVEKCLEEVPKDLQIMGAFLEENDNQMSIVVVTTSAEFEAAGQVSPEPTRMSENR